MPQTTIRAFHVHAGHLDRHHGRVVEEPTFEAAAVAYVEALPTAEAELRVIVRDLENGREHCFVVDLETGGTAACG